MPSKIHYVCQRCGNCCRWPGFVKLAEGETGKIAEFLGVSEHDFIQRFTRLRPNREGLALMDKPNEECIFFENGGCAIQPVKPQQCRDFPNQWNFPGWREVCEAIPVEVEENHEGQEAREGEAP
jgi:Fe-S-cluster containining protein